LSVFTLSIAVLLAGGDVTQPQSAAPILPYQISALADAAPTDTTASGTAPDDAAAKGDDAIIVTATPGVARQDPFEGVNMVSYDTVQVADTALVKPVAMGYKAAVPSPVRSGLRNVLRNLNEPVIALNFLLQLKPGKAVKTVGRFAINSTLGAAGLFDVAKKPGFNLPYRVNGFGYTLGYYGVKPGPFLFLPLIGPTSVRDLVGRSLDLLVLPTAVGGPFRHPVYAIGAPVIRSLDDRVESEPRFQRYDNDPEGPYNAMRRDYLTTRQAEIDALRGKKAKPAAPQSR